MSETKLASFLNTQKLNPKRLLAASHKLETLQKGDRDIKLAKRRAKGGEAAAAPAEGEKKPLEKPRSGRAVTPRALNAALSGSATVSGPTKQRILRAVNYLLEQKKKDKVELKTLF